MNYFQLFFIGLFLILVGASLLKKGAHSKKKSKTFLILVGLLLMFSGLGIGISWPKN